MNIKSVVTGGDRNAIVDECIAGEEHTLKNYEEALRKDLPVDLQSVISRQYAQVEDVYQHIKSLKVVMN